MADHAWEDVVAPALDSLAWTLQKAKEDIVCLNGVKEAEEFFDLAVGLGEIEYRLVELRNGCFERRG